jgi:hypothetical protein
MSRGLNDAQVDALADRLRGTSDALDEALDDLELPHHDHDEIEHQLSAVNVERCKGCSSWVDVSDLTENDDGEMVCSDC